jgi:hypothetical protein
MKDCEREMKGLLGEEVRRPRGDQTDRQRLAGATLLVFANKQDLSGSLSLTEIRDVGLSPCSCLTYSGFGTAKNHFAPMASAALFGVYGRGTR